MRGGTDQNGSSRLVTDAEIDGEFKLDLGDLALCYSKEKGKELLILLKPVVPPMCFCHTVLLKSLFLKSKYGLIYNGFMNSFGCYIDFYI